MLTDEGHTLPAEMRLSNPHNALKGPPFTQKHGRFAKDRMLEGVRRGSLNTWITRSPSCTSAVPRYALSRYADRAGHDDWNAGYSATSMSTTGTGCIRIC